MIRVIDIAARRVAYRYGKPGVSGAGPNRLWNPDDARMLDSGAIVTADIKNQRILLIGSGAHRPTKQWGDITTATTTRHGTTALPTGSSPWALGASW